MLILTVKSLAHIEPNKLFDCMTDAFYQQVMEPIVIKVVVMGPIPEKLKV